MCFEDLNPMPHQVSSLCLGLWNSYPRDNRSLNIRLVVEEIIDKSSPWGYFDGSAIGVPHICSAGGLLYISDEHCFTFSTGLGFGTNNFAELIALNLLFTLALKYEIHTL